MLQSSTTQKPQNTIQKLFQSLVLFYFLNLNWFYVSELSGILSQPSYEPKILTITDFINSDKIVKFPDGYLHLFQGKRFSDDVLTKRVLYDRVKSYEEEVQDFAKELDHGIISSNTKIFFIKNKHEVQMVNRECLATFQNFIVVRKGFPLLEKMNNVILRIRQSGLMSKWIYESQMRINRTVVNLEELSRSLDLRGIACAFIVFGVGIFMSIAAFTFELAYHLRDHGTFNLKLTIVVVMGQKEEIRFSQFVVHPSLKEHGHIHPMLTKCTVSSPLIVHVVFFTWYPYNFENQCGTVFNLVKIKSRNPYENKIIGKLNNCPVTVTWDEVALGIKSPFDKADPGYFIRAVDTVLQKVGLTPIYLKENLQYFTLLRMKGHYNDLRDHMLKNKIDMAILTLKLSNTEISFMEISDFFTDFYFFFVLPPRRQITNSTETLVIFKGQIWLLILVTSLLLAVLWKFIMKNTLQNSFFEIIQIILQSSTTENPTGTTQKFFFCLVFFYCLNLNWFYVSGLSGVLSQPSYEPKISTINDLIQSNKVLKFPNGYETLFKEKSYFSLLLKKRVDRKTKSYEEHVQDFAEELDHGIITSSSRIYFIKDYQKLQILDRDKIGILTNRLLIRKGFPVLNKINFFINRVRESGFNSKWVYESQMGINRTSFNFEQTISSLDMHRIVCAFVVLGVGISLSVVVAIMEIIVTWEPAAFAIKSPTNKTDPGYFIRLLDAVLAEIGLNPIYLTENINYFGLVTIKGHYDDLEEYMIKNNIGLAMITKDSMGPPLKYLEISRFFSDFDVFFILPPRSRITNSVQILQIFTAQTWFLIFISTLLLVVLWKLITQKTFHTSFFQIIEMMLQLSTTQKPQNTLQTLFKSMVLFYFLNLNWFYVSELSGILSHPSYEPKILTITDLINSNKIVKFPDGYLPIFRGKRFRDGVLSKRALHNGTKSLVEEVHDFAKELDHGIVTTSIRIFYIKNKDEVQMVNREYVSL
ncbi:hypothetical protein Zmor_018051 [Zophobas morio]|uniref:Ionotropic receptor n=1 Tax=Zophobas morio TaxID=2755281 RepID=A0AA38I9S4_9CUCU|nr:hypothetical protein Zmor_018051 [Zophobas morio]